jgi:hypothetical protein
VRITASERLAVYTGTELTNLVAVPLTRAIQPFDRSSVAFDAVGNQTYQIAYDPILSGLVGNPSLQFEFVYTPLRFKALLLTTNLPLHPPLEIELESMNPADSFQQVSVFAGTNIITNLTFNSLRFVLARNLGGPVTLIASATNQNGEVRSTLPLDLSFHWANDDFADAEEIPGDLTYTILNVDLHAATDEPGEPLVSDYFSHMNRPSQGSRWWKWTPKYEGPLTIELPYPMQYRLYSGDSTSVTNLVGTPDLEANKSYYIHVQNFYPGMPAFGVLPPSPPYPNAIFSQRTLFMEPPATNTFNEKEKIIFTLKSTDPRRRYSPVGLYMSGQEFFQGILPPSSVSLPLSASAEFHDGVARVSFTLPPGSYRDIGIIATNDLGQVLKTESVTLIVHPANDLFERAEPLSIPSAVSRSTLGATFEPADLYGHSFSGGSVWWKFYPTTTAPIEVRVVNWIYPAPFFIFAGHHRDDLIALTNNVPMGYPSSESLIITPAPDETYYVEVESPGMVSVSLRNLSANRSVAALFVPSPGLRLLDVTEADAYGFRAQVYVGSSPYDLEPVGLPQVPTLLRTNFATLDFTAPGTTLLAQVRAWDLHYGTNYEQARAAGSPFARSDIGAITTGTDESSASPLNGITEPHFQTGRTNFFSPRIDAYAPAIQNSSLQFHVTVEPGFIYQVQKKKWGRPWQTLLTTNNATSGFEFSDAMTGQLYFYRVRMVD